MADHAFECSHSNLLRWDMDEKLFAKFEALMSWLSPEIYRKSRCNMRIVERNLPCLLFYMAGASSKTLLKGGF